MMKASGGFGTRWMTDLVNILFLQGLQFFVSISIKKYTACVL